MPALGLVNRAKLWAYRHKLYVPKELWTEEYKAVGNTIQMVGWGFVLAITPLAVLFLYETTVYGPTSAGSTELGGVWLGVALSFLAVTVSTVYTLIPRIERKIREANPNWTPA
jgi:hypothetical protein